MSDVLAALVEEARRNVEGASAFPAIPQPEPNLPSMLQTLRAVVEIIEMLVGRRGTDATTAALKASVESEIRRIEGMIP